MFLPATLLFAGFAGSLAPGAGLRSARNPGVTIAASARRADAALARLRASACGVRGVPAEIAARVHFEASWEIVEIVEIGGQSSTREILAGHANERAREVRSADAGGLIR